MSTDIFLKLDGIVGESTDAKHAGWIELASWSTSWEQPIAMAKTATGPSVERCKHEPITVAKIMDKASIGILKHVWGGTVIKEGWITAWRARKDATPHNYLVIYMQSIIIATYSMGGGEGEMPQEELGLSCGYLKFQYKEMPHEFSEEEGGVHVADVNRVKGTIGVLVPEWTEVK